jgi:hypothetical protein
VRKILREKKKKRRRKIKNKKNVKILDKYEGFIKRNFKQGQKLSIRM